MKLNQVIAIEGDARIGMVKALGDAINTFTKPKVCEGETKTYEPLKEDGEQLPTEEKLVQVRVDPVIADLMPVLIRAIDLTASKDEANGLAKADVVIGTTTLKDIPAIQLLSLEKSLAALDLMLEQVPVYDTAHAWTWDSGQSIYRSSPVKTSKTKKMPVPIPMAEATHQHQATFHMHHDDVTIGHYVTTKLSGAWSPARLAQVRGRVKQLKATIKMAREEANNVTAPTPKVGQTILDYIFAT